MWRVLGNQFPTECVLFSPVPHMHQVWLEGQLPLRQGVCEWGSAALSKLLAPPAELKHNGTVEKAWAQLQMGSQTTIQRCEEGLTDSDDDEVWVQVGVQPLAAIQLGVQPVTDVQPVSAGYCSNSECSCEKYRNPRRMYQTLSLMPRSCSGPWHYTSINKHVDKW